MIAKDKDIKTVVPPLRFPEFRDGEGWNRTRLGKLFKIGNGKDYKHLSAGNIPVYGSGGYMTSVDYHLYEGESVCIGRKGTIDKPLFLTGKFWTVDTLFYTHSFNDCLPPFVYLIFQNINWLKHNEAGGVPSLSKVNIERIEVFVPNEKGESKGEQQRIADCLGSLDDLISAVEDKIEVLNLHKKGLMQQLFPAEGKTSPISRFPEFQNVGEWIPMPTGSIFTIFQGFAFKSNDSRSEGVRWLKIADVGIQKMNHNSPSFLPWCYVVEYEKYIIMEGDYVIALTRPILNRELKIAPANDIYHNSLLNQRVGKLVSLNNNNKTFLYYLLQTSKLIDEIEKNIAGSEPPNLSTKQMEDIIIPIPSPKEQQKIADFFSVIDEQIVAESRKFDQLKVHKKGLMQQLFPTIDE